MASEIIIPTTSTVQRTDTNLTLTTVYNFQGTPVRSFDFYSGVTSKPVNSILISSLNRITSENIESGSIVKVSITGSNNFITIAYPSELPDIVDLRDAGNVDSVLPVFEKIPGPFVISGVTYKVYQQTHIISSLNNYELNLHF